MKYKCIVTVLGLFLPTILVAQGMDETIEYIKSKTESIEIRLDDTLFGQEYQSYEVNIGSDKCQIDLVRKKTSGWRFTTAFILSDLDPEQFTVTYENERYYLNLVSKEYNAMTMTVVDPDGKRRSNRYQRDTEISSLNEELLNRLSRAFKRAAELCEANDPFAEDN